MGHVDGENKGGLYGGNDGDIGAPVYSLTLGNTCNFDFKLVKSKERQTVELRSGDIIIFGGPQRLMCHCCKNVILGSFTEKENFNARINLTFRTCSSLTEKDDDDYKTENYTKRMQEQWNKKKFNL